MKPGLERTLRNYRLLGNLEQMVVSSVQDAIDFAREIGDDKTADLLERQLSAEITPLSLPQKQVDPANDRAIEDLVNLYGNQ